MISAYSSGVPVKRLLDAILGTSPATWIWAKRPSAEKIKMPLGVSPNGNDFLPSGAVTSATTKFQVPTIWSFRLLAGCAAAAPADRTSASQTAAMVFGFMVSSPKLCIGACYPGTHRCAMLLRNRFGMQPIEPVPCDARHVRPCAGIHVLLLRFGTKDVDGRDEARP